MTFDEAINEVANSPDFKQLKKERAKVVNHIMGLTMKQFPNFNPKITRRVIERLVDA